MNLVTCVQESLAEAATDKSGAARNKNSFQLI